MSPRTPSAGPPGLPREVEALYQAPLAGFVDARNALAMRLRKTDADVSARVKALPKPSAPAWALNQVYWRARDDYERMIAAGDRLRSLQQQMLAGRAADPRDVMRERQAAVRAVVERALAFLAEAGQPPTDATRQRINVTADALATWGSHPHGYMPGYLDRELEPPGFDALASLRAPALRLVKSPTTPGGGATLAAGTEVPAPREQREVPVAAKGVAAKAAKEAARAREAERRRLTRTLQDAEREARARQSAYERATSALSRATADAEAARRELATLERQLATVRARAERAERARVEAEASADAARRAHAEAEDDAAQAKQAVDAMRG
jgi:hypothetical protein